MQKFYLMQLEDMVANLFVNLDKPVGDCLFDTLAAKSTQ